MAHDLTRDELSGCLYAWAYLVACAAPLAESLPLSLAWTRACWDAGEDHLPLVLVHDLGHLLLLGQDYRFASARDLALWPASERARRLAYEDRVVGRWALDPSVAHAHIIIAGLAPSHRDAAVAHAIALALGRSLRDAEPRVTGNPAHLRALVEPTLAAVPDSFEGWAELLDPEWIEWAADQIALATPMLSSAKLFRPEDLWELEHLPELPSESARLALREVTGLAGRVGPVSASVALSIRQRSQEVPIEAEEADQYPAGGFDAVSTRGTFENMVRSEVAYVGEGASLLGGVDLFDVRFAESELLYYTRDESPLLDARRDLTVVFDQASRQRSKHAALGAQTLVIAEALALVLQADLLRVFGPAGSHVRLVWRCDSDDDRTAADEEMALLALSLASEIAHRRVELSRVDAWSEVPGAGRVVLSPRAPQEELPWVAWARVDAAVWRCLELEWDVSQGEATLRALADALLIALAGRRVRSARPRRARSA